MGVAACRRWQYLWFCSWRLGQCLRNASRNPSLWHPWQELAPEVVASLQHQAEEGRELLSCSVITECLARNRSQLGQQPFWCRDWWRCDHHNFCTQYFFMIRAHNFRAVFLAEHMFCFQAAKAMEKVQRITEPFGLNHTQGWTAAIFRGC